MAHLAFSPHRERHPRALVFGLFFLFGVCSAAAQTTFGAITGTVTDATGAVIGGATISVLNERTGIQRLLTTSDTGVYFAPNLAPGIYSVRIAKEGFRGYQKTGMHLAANQVINLDTRLVVSSAATTVDVVGAYGAELNTQTPTLNNVIPSTQLEQLPIITRQKGDQGLWGYASYNNGISHEPFFVPTARATLTPSPRWTALRRCHTKRA